VRLVGKVEVIAIDAPLWVGWLGFGTTIMPADLDYNCGSLRGKNR
jgi:hypothetical protein